MREWNFKWDNKKSGKKSLFYTIIIYLLFWLGFRKTRSLKHCKLRLIATFHCCCSLQNFKNGKNVKYRNISFSWSKFLFNTQEIFPRLLFQRSLELRLFSSCFKGLQTQINWDALTKLFNLIHLGLLGTAHGRGWSKKDPRAKTSYKYQTRMKLETVIP